MFVFMQVLWSPERGKGGADEPADLHMKAALSTPTAGRNHAGKPTAGSCTSHRRGLRWVAANPTHDRAPARDRVAPGDLRIVGDQALNLVQLLGADFTTPESVSDRHATLLASPEHRRQAQNGGR